MTTITLIPGDGIGPEITAGARRVVNTACPDIDWDTVEAGERAYAREGTPVPAAVTESIKRTTVALKGPLTNPMHGYTSPNLQIYARLGIWYRIRTAQSYEGPNQTNSNPDISIVLIRDIKEGWIKNSQHDLGDDTGIAISYTTRTTAERIARIAYAYASAHGLRQVTIAHQGRVLRSTDGRYLAAALAVANDFPNLDIHEELLDSLCTHLVTTPHSYQLLLTPNPYGGALEGLCAGLTGGAGLMASSTHGDDVAVFEASHGTAPKHAGHNRCNPTAIIEAAASMLDHIGRPRAAQLIRTSLRDVIKAGRTVTYDLGGTASTSDMANAICQQITARSA